METLNLIPQLAPATIMVAMATLPWIAATLMLALSAASSPARDDEWNTRAAAAIRWAGALAEPDRGQRNAVVQVAARRISSSNNAVAVQASEFYPQAA